jgi:hypothetical protein
MVAGGFHAGDAFAHQQDVQIVRGGAPASIIETLEANVRVFRGTPVAIARKPAGAQPINQVVAAGSRIWIVDRATDKLSVCRLVSTTQVGEHRIDCQAATLPR